MKTVVFLFLTFLRPIRVLSDGLTAHITGLEITRRFIVNNRVKDYAQYWLYQTHYPLYIPYWPTYISETR